MKITLLVCSIRPNLIFIIAVLNHPFQLRIAILVVLYIGHNVSLEILIETTYIQMKFQKHIILVILTYFIH